MKKVLVMAAALSLLAAPALASSVVNSKHNLSVSRPAGATVYATNYTEVCVFCHTPHGGQNKDNAPLWNRTYYGTAFTAANMYNSSTLEASSKANANDNINQLNASDAPLCFSCHDGASVGDALLNPANTSGNANPVFASTAMGSADILLDNTNSMLKNDHPVGISYIDAYTTEASSGANGLFTTAEVNTKSSGKVKVTYGDGERLWCSSCHDVHDDAYGPFLVMTNSASKLCIACHNK